MENKINVEAVKSAIEIAGGVSKLASMIGVSYQTVLNWKNGRTTISLDNCIKIELSTQGKIKRGEIMPSYTWLNINQEGQKDEKSQIAKNLLVAGVDVDTIAKTTGISVEELKKIKS